LQHFSCQGLVWSVPYDPTRSELRTQAPATQIAGLQPESTYTSYGTVGCIHACWRTNFPSQNARAPFRPPPTPHTPPPRPPSAPSVAHYLHLARSPTHHLGRLPLATSCMAYHMPPLGRRHYSPLGRTPPPAARQATTRRQGGPRRLDGHGPMLGQLPR